jgi:hypothetical protein
VRPFAHPGLKWNQPNHLFAGAQRFRNARSSTFDMRIAARALRRASSIPTSAA